MTTWDMPLAGLVTTIGVIVLGTFDLCCVCFKGTGSSVSNFLINAGFRSPVYVFALGYIAGHLTGYMYPVQKKTEEKKETGAPDRV